MSGPKFFWPNNETWHSLFVLSLHDFQNANVEFLAFTTRTNLFETCSRLTTMINHLQPKQLQFRTVSHPLLLLLCTRRCCSLHFPSSPLFLLLFPLRTSFGAFAVRSTSALAGKRISCPVFAYKYANAARATLSSLWGFERNGSVQRPIEMMCSAWKV